MSGLADKIRGIVAPRADAPPAAVPATAPSRQQPGASTSLDLLGGVVRDDVFVVERRVDGSTRHGRHLVGEAAERLDAAAEHAPLFGAAQARPPFLFIDLETTGLSGGAGTHAFLVGCASFAPDRSFVTRQFLMTHFAGERALLAAVARQVDAAGALVSYNGKSFDAPLLETRYLFHRLEWGGSRVPHVDALHPSRRFWGGDTEAGCTLQSLERAVVGCRPRVGDVPGFEVPSRYFQFVRTGDARPLAQVLEHNRLDLLTLAIVSARLLHLARVGPDEVQVGAEALALGRVYARAHLEDRARASFRRAIDLSRAPAGAFDPVRVDALRLLALAWRRVRQYDEAARCWRALIDTRGCPPGVRREAAEGLAIHHEHRVRDLDGARTFALESLDVESRPAWTRAVEHRLARLDRKLAASHAEGSRLNPREKLLSFLEPSASTVES